MWDSLNKAVDESYRTMGLDQAIPRAEIAKRFIKEGAKRSTVFRRIDERVRELQLARAVAEAEGVTIEPPPEPPPPPIPTLPLEPGGTVERAAHAVAKMDAAVTAEAIPFLQLFQANLRELAAILALSKKSDGSIKNPRLAQSVVDSIGKQLGLAARVQQVVEARQRQEEFMQGLVDIVLRQEPAVRDKLVAEMQALRLRYGADPR